ncbi:MAG: hypothetical protein ABI596_14865, partial [Pyrinomonadaceae bacterium]
LLRGLTSREGRPLVKNVIRNAGSAEDALALRLPDLVVHWHTAALASPVTIANTDLVTYPIGTKFTGGHEMDGFLISRGNWDIPVSEAVHVGDLHQLINQALAATEVMVH